MSETNSKAQSEFYVAKGETHLGPWSIDEVAMRLAQNEIAITDFVYDDGRADWIPLMECEALKERLRKAKPKAPPKPMAKTETVEAAKPVPTPVTAAPKVEAKPELLSIEHVIEHKTTPGLPKAPQNPLAKATGEEEWFVQKGAHRYGPFAYHGLVRALQEKTVYDFDFAWKEGMSTWVRIAELEAFAPDKIRELAGKMSAQPDVFFRRQYARVPFDSEVIVHDDRSVWMGQAFEASVGGSGVVIENSTLVPGQVIRLHFAPHDGLPAFNALGEIVGKRYSKEVRGAKSPVRYAVRFLKLDGAAEPTVREYFETKQVSQAS